MEDFDSRLSELEFFKTFMLKKYNLTEEYDRHLVLRSHKFAGDLDSFFARKSQGAAARPSTPPLETQGGSRGGGKRTRKSKRKKSSGKQKRRRTSSRTRRIAR